MDKERNDDIRRYCKVESFSKWALKEKYSQTSTSIEWQKNVRYEYPEPSRHLRKKVPQYHGKGRWINNTVEEQHVRGRRKETGLQLIIKKKKKN